jgi:peptidoglycan/xylan/chitin deacetylase (PgdA/CDA1 family)
MKTFRGKKRFAFSLMVILASFGLSGCGLTPNAQSVQSTKSTQSKQSVSSKKPLTTQKMNMAIKHTEGTEKPNLIDTTIKRPVKITSISVPILEYHNSAYVKNWPWSLNPGQFEKEMAWLHKNDFHSVTLQQVYYAYKYGAKLPSRPVVISFDDGNVSNYTMGFPILKKYGFKATEFVVTAAIGKKGVLSKQDILAMQNSGYWTIESHSVHHPHLSKIPEKKMIYELTESKKVLTKLLGRPVNFFCYPYGDYDPKVVQEVGKAGYLLATTVHHGYANPVAQRATDITALICASRVTSFYF